MTNQWPDDHAEFESTDIDKILDEELAQEGKKPMLRPTDRKWDHVDASKISAKHIEANQIKPAGNFVVKFFAYTISIAIVVLVLLIIFGLLIQAFQWVLGLVR